MSDLREPWITQLKHRDTGVRLATVEALGGIGKPGCVAPLIQALGDSDRRVREAAEEALVKIGSPAFEALIQALESSAWGTRLAAVRTLIRIEDVRRVDPLIRTLGDENANVRE